MKQSSPKKMTGAPAFDSFYSGLFGGRWEELKKALSLPSVYAGLSFEGCEPYFLDPASVAAALCLPVRQSEKILDLCAAPGGKTLVLCGTSGSHASLHANERSPSRKIRLAKVIASSLPPDISGRVRISCTDGSVWCRRESECYGSILLDAPCSSERHVLNDKSYLDKWSPARVKSAAAGQWALLSCAYRLLQPGGFLLYATCALCPAENDGAVSRLIKKFPDASVIQAEEVLSVFRENNGAFSGSIACPQEICPERILSLAERTESGFHILPDRASGAGPIYFSLIQKPSGFIQNNNN